MEKINILFLGTGSAIPTKKRNHPGILISFANEIFLFDCGEGIQRQFKYTSFKPTKITRIFITHWHGDHILGLPGLFQTLAMSNYQKTLKIYGPIGTKHFISKIKELLKNIKIKIEIFEFQNGICLDENSFYVECREMIHDAPTLAYAIVLKEKMRIKKEKINKLKIPNSPKIKDLLSKKDIIIEGKKIAYKSLTYKEKGKKITIILDTLFNEKAIQLAKNSDLLICESTYSSKEEKEAEKYKHLTSIQSATIAKKAKVKSLILTHFSQRYENPKNIIEKEAKKIFRKTKTAEDFEQIVI